MLDSVDIPFEKCKELLRDSQYILDTALNLFNLCT